MTPNMRRNIGRRIYRDYPALPFIVKVWGLDIENLPENSNCNLPRPIRSTQQTDLE